MVGDPEVATRLAILKLAEHAEHLCYRFQQEDLEWSRFGPLVIDCLSISEPDLEDIQADLVEQLRML